MAHYALYYGEQAGGGISSWYKGASYQRGSGLGSFLAGLARTAMPLLKSVGKSVARETLSGGLRVLDDVGNDVPLKQALKNRAVESMGNLKNKTTRYLLGRGGKRRKRAATAGRQSKTQTRKGKTLSRRKVKPAKKKQARRSVRGRKKSTRSKYDLLAKTTDIFG